jgi:hypothetical protein
MALVQSSRWVACGALLSCLSGCGHLQPEPPQTASQAESAKETLPSLEGESGPTVALDSPRRVGDVWVHRFSGSYRSHDLVLREEVVGDKDDMLLVDFIFEEGDSLTHFRTEMSKRSERIVAVYKLEDDILLPVSTSDLDQMLEKTTHVPEQNRGKISQKQQTCLVGKNELNCELTAYQVRLDGKDATLSVSRNQDLGRDIAGEITAVDGTVLYHAELIEMKRGHDSNKAKLDGVALREPID